MGSGGGSGGGTGTGSGSGSSGGADAGTIPVQTGCAPYVMCLDKAMSAADAMACNTAASSTATQLLDAVDQCALDFCVGMNGGTARCKLATDGSPQNLDGTAAFDMNGMPVGDCATCLLNVDAGLFGEQCQPTTDAACNTTACATQVAACQASQ
jgi:hypothetical protein